MQKPSRNRQEVYRSFLEFVSNDIQHERRLVNRRMLSVFIWCFFLPVLLSICAILLVKAHVLPRQVRLHLDWPVLILPISYSLYFLGAEVLSQVPVAVRKGGVAHSLGQSLKEGEWRDRVIESMTRSLDASLEEWEWITASFKMDLQSMQYRAKYLTVLSGAVFYLLMHGIDALSEGEGTATFVKTSALGWIETTPNDLSEYVGLALFLVLLYLSGSQTTQALHRYLGCTQWITSRLARKD